MKLYAYCLCADLETFDNELGGVSGATVQVLKVEDLSVLVSTVEVVPATQENALAHAAVVRSVFAQTTLVPFRFGTLGTEQQLRNYVTSHRVAFTNKLAQLRGCVEMDLKIVWRRSGAKATPSNQPVIGPGTAFLRAKRRELLGDEQTAAQRAELSGLLREELGSLIKDEEMELQPSPTVVLAKVFHLVESSKLEQYREKIAGVVETRREMQVSMSGPWPPYSFANIELEFKSQFGVS
ncbi:MAG TPA: GvpL/GvpF family gas vesicle protein [Pyrinomonadaceae bacterium]|jgi:hypothetical protein|nr:GvpL/GvpF family gas vesicle protein [Pyrinomonadaceae bacterium]